MWVLALQAAAAAAAQQELTSAAVAAASPAAAEAATTHEAKPPPLPDHGPQPPPDEPHPPPDEPMPPPEDEPPVHPSEEEVAEPPVPPPQAEAAAALVLPADSSAAAVAAGTASDRPESSGTPSTAVQAPAPAQPDAALPAAMEAHGPLQAAAQPTAVGLEEGELPAEPQLGSATSLDADAAPVAAQADDSMDMDVDEVSPAAVPPATAAPPPAPATCQPTASAQQPPASSAAAAEAAEAPACSVSLAPTASSGAAVHPAVSVAWPMPHSGPMAMPFTWSFYYPPPGYPPMHAFSAAHGPHTLPHPAMFAQPDALHLAHGSAPLSSAAYAAAASPSPAHTAAAAPAPAADAAAAMPAPEQRREYWAQPVRAPQANGAVEDAEEPPPLPGADGNEQPPEPSPVRQRHLYFCDMVKCWVVQCVASMVACARSIVFPILLVEHLRSW